MTKKLVFLWMIGLLALSACSSAATPTAAPVAEEPVPTEEVVVEPTEIPEPEALAFTDDFGGSFELDNYPQTIVSISNSTTEILFFVGAGAQVAGRDDFSLYPEEAQAVPSIGSLWGELPTEAILALEPDLVVAAEIISADQVQALRDLGLNVYHQANPKDFEGLYENLRDIAALTGHVDETEAKIAELETRVQAVLTKIAPSSFMPAVFYELDASMDPANPWTTGSGTFIDYIISLAGGFNVASNVAGDYIQISSEQLIAANPDVILLSDALYGMTVESVATRPGWEAIKAVQNNAIYPIDPNLMSAPGPRLVDALEETARLLHPEMFE